MAIEFDFEAALAEARQQLQPVPPDLPVEIVPAEPAMREETWQAILQAVGRGMTLPRACALCGASLSSVKRLLKADPSKARVLRQAKANLIGSLTDVVVETALGDGDERGPDWRAAAWLLPKLDPSLQERKKPTVSITNQTLNVGDAQQIQGMSKEELRKFLGAD